MFLKIFIIFYLFLITSVTFAIDCQTYQRQCASSEKYPIHLSFDDGPADVTATILDVLKKEKIKATFFVIANKVDCPVYKNACDAGDPNACYDLKICRENRKILQRVKNEGHMIGSHGYQHIHHSKLPPKKLRREIQRSKQVLKNYFSTQPPLFRLPYGDGWFNRQQYPDVLKALSEQGFQHIAWEMSAYDWRRSDQQGDKILNTVINEICTKKRGTILFHDGVHNQIKVGRLFTAANIGRWIPAMKCVAKFVPFQP